MKKLLLTSIAAMLLATGTAMAEPPDLEGPVHHPHSYSRDEIGRCFLPHTPGNEQLAEHEQCCKRWPNVPYCNGDWTRAMQTILEVGLSNAVLATFLAVIAFAVLRLYGYL